MPDDERPPRPGPDETEEEDEEEDIEPTESAPLLSNQHETDEDGDEDEDSRPPKKSWLSWLPRRKASKSRSSSSDARRGIRWPSIIAIIIMAIIVVLLIVLGFVAPPAVKSYVENAAVLEPTGLKIESITPDGIRARIQANFRLDGSRVSDANSRRLGKATTGIMRKLGTEETQLHVYLPNYDNVLLGSAVVPPLTIDIVEGHNNALDFVTDLNPGDAENVRKIANDWLDGNLDYLKVTGKAAIQLKSGIFPLGTHDVVESMVFEAQQIPTMPEYSIERLNFHDVPADDHDGKVVGADVSIEVQNDYPVALDVPPLAFEVLLANCDPSMPYISVAEAMTKVIEIRANSLVTANARGIMREIPESLTRACPTTNQSPLDQFMNRYLNGETAKVFIRGKKMPDSDTPEWIEEILQSITVPFDFPGSSFDSLIRNFSLADVSFKLPSPFADPSDPDSHPRVSGLVQVLAALPSEFNIDIGVDSVRADADLLYENEKLGELNLHKWQQANSTKLIGVGGTGDLLNITSRVDDVPLNITDNKVFADVMQKMLFGDEDVVMGVKAAVDVKVATVLGNLILRDVPAEGKVPVNGIGGDVVRALDPKVGDLRILSTTDRALHLQAVVNVTNPTPYTAFIPSISVQVFNSDHQIGMVVAEDLDFRRGVNTDVLVTATWDPLSFGGEKAQVIGQKLLSDYMSGKNTTLTVKPYRGSVPSLPELGEALSNLNITIPAPRFKLPGDDDGPVGQHFIREATFHIVSSVATFVLASPLHYNTIHIEAIEAVAFYNHTEPVGNIIDDQPFDAPPGLSQTPRLPVTWSPGHVGLDKLKAALGGSLKLDAVANVTLRLGSWVEKLRYEGQGIGAKIRI